MKKALLILSGALIAPLFANPNSLTFPGMQLQEPLIETSSQERFEQDLLTPAPTWKSKCSTLLQKYPSIPHVAFFTTAGTLHLAALAVSSVHSSPLADAQASLWLSLPPTLANVVSAGWNLNIERRNVLAARRAADNSNNV